MTDSDTVPILYLRGRAILIDADLASLYGVATKRLNEQAKRNADRFPEDFLFRLDEEEVRFLKSHFATSKHRSKYISDAQTAGRGGRRKPPFAYTEHGALMAANVLKSPKAIQMSIFVIRAFLKQREALVTNQIIVRRLAEIEKSLLVHDSALKDLYQKLLPLIQSPEPKPKRPIGF